MPPLDPGRVADLQAWIRRYGQSVVSLTAELQATVSPSRREQINAALAELRGTINRLSLELAAEHPLLAPPDGSSEQQAQVRAAMEAHVAAQSARNRNTLRPIPAMPVQPVVVRGPAAERARAEGLVWPDWIARAVQSSVERQRDTSEETMQYCGYVQPWALSQPAPAPLRQVTRTPSLAGPAGAPDLQTLMRGRLPSPLPPHAEVCADFDARERWPEVVLSRVVNEPDGLRWVQDQGEGKEVLLLAVHRSRKRNFHGYVFVSSRSPLYGLSVNDELPGLGRSLADEEGPDFVPYPEIWGPVKGFHHTQIAPPLEFLKKMAGAGRPLGDWWYFGFSCKFGPDVPAYSTLIRAYQETIDFGKWVYTLSEQVGFARRAQDVKREAREKLPDLVLELETGPTRSRRRL